jgi:hypothetical protein
VDLGESFVNLSPQSPPHLWIVISKEGPGGFVVANLTSRVPGCDETCVVKVGEHPWVRHDSVIAYARAQLLSRQAIDVLKKLGCYAPKEPVSAQLLLRIQRGALESPYMKQRYQAQVRETLGT